MRNDASQRLVVRDFPYSLQSIADADYIQTGVTTNPSQVDCSLLIWVQPLFAPNQPNGYSPNNAHYFYGQQAGVGQGRNWLFISNTLSAGIRQDYIASNLGGVETMSAFRIEAGRWYLLGLTYDHTNHVLKLYVNGVLVSTTTRTAESATGTHYLLQQQSLAGNRERSFLSRYLFFNRLLTDQEIADYYFLNDIDLTSLRCEYDIDEGSGTSLTDKSGNGLTGTVSGPTWNSNSPFKSRNFVT